MEKFVLTKEHTYSGSLILVTPDFSLKGAGNLGNEVCFQRDRNGWEFGRYEKINVASDSRTAGRSA